MKELAKKTREVLNKNYPIKKGFKFSVMSTYNSVSVTVLSAPFAAWDKDKIAEYNSIKGRMYAYFIDADKLIGRSYESVTHYSIKDDSIHTDEMQQLLIDIYDLINADKYIVSEDDYGSTPNYYISMAIGSHNKPFRVKGGR